MKFIKFSYVAAMCAMMASCANEAPENTTNITKENGYAAFTVNLPTAQGTGSRAVTDEQGTPDEYAVNNGRVLIFRKGASEADATFVCMSDLSGLTWSDATTGEVTTTAKGVAELQDIDLKNNNVQYAAMVVLNYASDFKFPAAGQKFGAWSATAQTGSMILTANGKNYITMTSAPEYKSATQEPALLRDVDKSLIFQTAAQAASSSAAAAEAFVQRNVAKVSLSTKSSYTVENGLFRGDKVKVEAWGLDITNKTTYPVQVTDGLKASYSDIWNGTGTLARFIGTGRLFKRVFWAKDPNYSDGPRTLDGVKASFNVIDDVTANPGCIYALENTFDINNQLQGQTTRVLIKASYTPAGMAEGETFFRLGTQRELWSNATLKTQIENVAKNVLNSQNVTVDLGAVATTAGFHSLSEVSIRNNSSAVVANDLKAVAEALGLGDANSKNISTFVGGSSYYISRIKHFDPATETPWSVGDPTYNGDNLKWLGRYGIVRNNWYEVVVNSISDPGSPVVPEIKPDTPDDENEYFISVAVNILSWAKRVHNTDL